MTTKKISKFNPKWIIKTKNIFLEFLDASGFSGFDRHGSRGTKFKHPEWLIYVIAMLAVKMKIKTYLGIHRMAEEYWPLLAGELDLRPISERQLRDRLKKISFKIGAAPKFVFNVFPDWYFD